MDKYFHWKVILILAVIIGSVWVSYPPQQKVHLGLDLKGGVHLLLRVETEKIPEKYREGAVERAVEIIRNRIDEFGVREPNVTPQGKDKIIIELPGVTDEERAKNIVSKTAHLEFKLVSDDDKLLRQAIAAQQGGTAIPPSEIAETKEAPVVKTEAEKEKGEDETLLPGGAEEVLKEISAVMPAGYELKTLEGDSTRAPQTILLEKDPILTGDHLTNAVVGFDQYQQAIVQFQLDSEGAKIFDDVTFRNIGRRLAIVLDGKVSYAPVIRDRIPGGSGQISGNFTPAEASDLALMLRAGALPAPVDIIEERTVGPSLGQDSIRQGVRAAIGGAILVVIFMIGYYLFPGVIASTAVLLNLVILTGLLALSKASLTLPGIAGIILTIGMAVDANVLINERMREEMHLGKAIRSVISAGYHKAFSAIFDSNTTTILAAAILLWLGTGPIRGFAVTLIFGLMTSLFTALFLTRVVFDFLTRRGRHVNLKMLEWIKELKVDWMSKRKIGYVVTSLLVVGSITIFALRGQNNFGIDFRGGTLQEVHFNQALDLGTIRNALDRTGVTGAQLQRYGDLKDNNFIIRTKVHSEKLVRQALDRATGSGEYVIRRTDVVGPSVGKNLYQKGVKAIFVALLMMMIYMWYRFNLRFALCAILMVLHDVIISIGVFSAAGREFSLPILAAILTIIGYSINDTIIVYDRTRENTKFHRKWSIGDILNASINQTLSRTVITTVTTMLVVLSLFFFGGPAVNDFALILLVGFGLSVYSTIFVAAPLILDTSKR